MLPAVTAASAAVATASVEPAHVSTAATTVHNLHGHANGRHDQQQSHMRVALGARQQVQPRRCLDERADVPAELL